MKEFLLFTHDIYVEEREKKRKRGEKGGGEGREKSYLFPFSLKREGSKKRGRERRRGGKEEEEIGKYPPPLTLQPRMI